MVGVVEMKQVTILLCLDMTCTLACLVMSGVGKLVTVQKCLKLVRVKQILKSEVRLSGWRW